MKNIFLDVINNKDMNIDNGKFTCEACGSKITDNAKNINAHNKTKKHLDALEGKSKPKTNAADKMRDLRERRRVELGEEEYKRIQREEKQKQRAKRPKAVKEVKELSQEVRNEYANLINRINNVVKTNAPIDPNTMHVSFQNTAKQTNKFIEKVQGHKDCDNLNKKMFEAVQIYNKQHPEKPKKLTLKSIQTYHSLLERTYKKLYKTNMPNCENFDWFRNDYNKVIGVILNNGKLASQNTYIGHLAGYFSMLRDYQDIYQKLSLLSVQLSKKYTSIVKSGKKTDKQKERLIPLQELQEMSENLDDDNITENLIYYLYGHKQLPRRAKEYSNMIIVKMKANDSKQKFIDKLKNGSNYLLVSRSSSEPINFIFKDYKEKVQQILGTQVLEIEQTLKQALTNYIEHFKKKPGDYLFSKSTKNEGISNWSKTVSNAFQKTVGIPLSINDCRHIHATYYYKKSLPVSKLEEIAEKMGQSNFNTLLSYTRFDDE